MVDNRFHVCPKVNYGTLKLAPKETTAPEPPLKLSPRDYPKNMKNPIFIMAFVTKLG